MRKSTEELGQLTCRLPRRLLRWLDELSPGNRTYMLKTILEEAYERHSTGDADSLPEPEPNRKPKTSRRGTGTVRSQ
jgi:hypothetical protein